MSAVTLDPTTAATLTTAAGQVDLLDPAGRPVGVFLPPQLAAEAGRVLAFRRKVIEWGMAQIGNDELKRIAAKGGWRTTADVMKLVEGD